MDPFCSRGGQERWRFRHVRPVRLPCYARSAYFPLSSATYGLTMSNLDADTQEQVRNALARILSSEGFSASARNRRLLDYVVDETLAGRADRIKAYTLATVVFERGPDFDPQLDPVVRLEASRLRRALEHYYLTAGKDESDPDLHPQGLLYSGVRAGGCGVAGGLRQRRRATAGAGIGDDRPGRRRSLRL